MSTRSSIPLAGMVMIVMAPLTAVAQGFAPKRRRGGCPSPLASRSVLFAAEPMVRQPVAIEFDDRGRLWVIQYLAISQPCRAEAGRGGSLLADGVRPSPRAAAARPRGADRITILEDDDGDGRADRARDFVTGLNLASGLAFGDGGVFVLQVPYLLFYADRDHDDRPDGDPEVLLTGFGMEDASSVANSLDLGSRRLALRPSGEYGHGQGPGD